MDNGYSLVGQQNKTNDMIKFFKHPKTALMTIWCGDIVEQYMFCSKKDAISQFKKHNKLKGPVTDMNYCPFSL
jgi:hypothetical protein